MPGTVWLGEPTPTLTVEVGQHGENAEAELHEVLRQLDAVVVSREGDTLTVRPAVPDWTGASLARITARLNDCQIVRTPANADTERQNAAIIEAAQQAQAEAADAELDALADKVAELLAKRTKR